MRTTIVAVSAAILAQTTLGAEAQDWTDAPLELDPIIVSGGLTPVPADQNVEMIFNDLGVYKNMRLGTPCDDL